MSVHEKIKLVRQAKGLTQEEIAEKLGMSYNAYGDIERGDSDPKLSRLEKIANVFGISLSELLNLADNTVLNISFGRSDSDNRRGIDRRKHNREVNISSDSEFQTQKLKLICDYQDKEIELQRQKILDLQKTVEALEKKLSNS